VRDSVSDCLRPGEACDDWGGGERVEDGEDFAGI
jgi:hypothetical protein